MFHPDYHRRITEERNSDMMKEAEAHRIYRNKHDSHSGLIASVRARSAAMLITLGHWLMPNDAEVAITET